MSAGREINRLTGLSFAFFVGWEIIAPIFPLYALDVGATLIEVGFLLAVLSLVTLSVRVPFGTAATHLGTWLFMVLACALQIVSLTFLYFASSTTWLLAAVILYGLSAGSFGPLAISAVLSLAGSGERGNISGKYFFSFGLAIFLGPALTSLILWVFDYRQLFLIALIFPISAVVILAGLSSSRIPNLGKAPHSHQDSKTEILGQFIALFRNRRIVTIIIVMMLTHVCEGFFKTLFPVYSKESLLFSSSMISILFAFLGGTSTLVRIPAGRLTDAIGRKKPLLLSFGLSVAAFIAFGYARQFFLLTFAMAVYGVAWGLKPPASSALLADNVRPHEISVAMACVWMASDLGYSTGAAFAGYLGSTTSLPDIFLSLVILYIASMILALIGFRDVK